MSSCARSGVIDCQVGQAVYAGPHVYHSAPRSQQHLSFSVMATVAPQRACTHSVERLHRDMTGSRADREAPCAPCVQPRRTMPISDVVSRTSHTETTKGGDPSKVDKDGAGTIVTTLEMAEQATADGLADGDTTGGVTSEELRQADLTFRTQMHGPRATAAAPDTRLTRILELRSTHPAMFVHTMKLFAARDASIAQVEQEIAERDQQIADLEGSVTSSRRPRRPRIELAVCGDEFDNRRTACMTRVGQPQRRRR